MRTDGSPRLTLTQGGGGRGENGSASTIFGPVRAGLTTTRITPSRPRLVLLKGWGRSQRIPGSKSSKASVISNTVTTRPVGPGPIG